MRFYPVGKLKVPLRKTPGGETGMTSSFHEHNHRIYLHAWLKCMAGFRNGNG